MKARIIENTIVEILKPTPGFSINDCFHEDVLVDCIDVPPGANVGWIKNDQDEWVAPPPAPRTWVAEDIRKNLTFAEKVKWDSDKHPEAVTAKLELASPKEEAAVVEILDVLVAATIISSASKDKILA